VVKVTLPEVCALPDKCHMARHLGGASLPTRLTGVRGERVDTVLPVAARGRVS
jgi:hypothetical protein